MPSCQSCGSRDLELVLSLGYLPPPNMMLAIGGEARPQQWLPTDLMLCRDCELVQLDYVAAPEVVFAPDYAYTSGTTKALHDNFADLYQETAPMLLPGDLVVDIGSNDGTLLNAFAGHRVLGVEPTDIADRATVPTLKAYFNAEVAAQIRDLYGPAKLITCTNCLAHIADIHGAIEGIRDLLAPGGVFVSESHYLFSLLDALQYDTIYHEHLRYYSVNSLAELLSMHGLGAFKAQPIPTHGGSIRVFAARGVGEEFYYPEPTGTSLKEKLQRFTYDVPASKLRLLSELHEIKSHGGRICGIGAPSRAATVINYCRLDEAIIDCIYEKEGSLKIGKYMPGTRIPVVSEARLLEDQPGYAILFSWHIARELAPRLRDQGYRGKFIYPCAR